MILGVLSFGRMKNTPGYFGGCVVSDHTKILEAIRLQTQSFREFGTKDLIVALAFNCALEIVLNRILWSCLFHWIFLSGYRHKVSLITNLLRPDSNLKEFDKIPYSYCRQMGNLQAKLILEKIGGLKYCQARRVQIARQYAEGFQDIPEVVLPLRDITNGDVFLEFPMLVDAKIREKVFLKILESGLDCRKYYYRNCSDLEMFSKYSKGNLDQAESLERRVLMLPAYPELPDDVVQKYISVIRNVFCEWRRT